MSTTPSMVVTVIDGQRFTRTRDVAEFRRSLTLGVMDSGLTVQTAYAALWHRGVKVAEFVDWEEHLYGELSSVGSLNTTALESVFAGRASNAVVPLELRLHESSTNLIAAGLIPCCNNPPEGFDPPADLETIEYLRKSDFDANDDGVVDEAALPPVYTGSGMPVARDVWTLTAQNILDKFLALTFLPDRKLTQLTIENGAPPLYGEDFTVTVEPRQLSWDSLGLDGLLQAGDSLSFEYTYTPEE